VCVCVCVCAYDDDAELPIVGTQTENRQKIHW